MRGMQEPNPQPPKDPVRKSEAEQFFESVTNFTELYALLDKTTIGKSISHRIMTVIIDSKKFKPHRRFIAYASFLSTLVDPAIRDAVNRLLITQDPALHKIQLEETEKAEREANETFIRETTTQHIKNLQGKKEDKWGEYMDQTLNDANKIDTDHPGFLAALSTAYEELLKTTGKSVLETKPVKRPKPKATSEVKKEKGEKADSAPKTGFYKNLDGTEEFYVEGELTSRILQDKTREFYEKGKIKSKKFKDGSGEFYNEDGTVWFRTDSTGKVIEGERKVPDVEQKDKREADADAELEELIASVTKDLEESQLARKLENHLLTGLEKELASLQEAEKEEINKQKKESEVQKGDAGTEEILTDWKETIAVDTTKVVEPNAPETRDKKEESGKSTEEMSTPEKISSCFIEYCKNPDNLAEFNVKSFGRSMAKILSEINVKTIYRPINAQETYFVGRKSEASDMKAILVSIGGENYFLPYPLSVKEFDTLEDLFKFGADSSSPDKLQKIIPAEMVKKGKRWEVKTMGQLN